MNRFESFLAQQFEDYMTYRHQLGYDTDNLRWALKTVDRYLVTQNAGPNDLTPAFFLSLQADLHTQNKSINRLLCCTRKFFQYLVRIEYCRDNPLRDIPWLPEEHFIPFIFSPAQIEQLLAAVCRRLRKSSKHFVKDLGCYLAILLLARCGTRIYEPLRLMRDHFRADDKTLYIEKTKFKKDRLIPIPKALAAEITNYTCWRQANKNPSTTSSSAGVFTRPSAISASSAPDKPSATPILVLPPPTASDIASQLIL
jgi:site-specific recombinase XerD